MLKLVSRDRPERFSSPEGNLSMLKLKLKLAS
jgi:hypothetical protein